MRVSQFEIYRLVQRALEGSGAPYGVDRDGAQAVAWLESRGLPGLRLLQEDLPFLEGRFTGLALTGMPRISRSTPPGSRPSPMAAR